MPRWMRVYLLTTSASLGVVFLEPAPFDILLLGLFALAAALGFLRLSSLLSLSSLLVLIFAVSHIIPFMYLKDVDRAVHYAMITAYMVVIYVTIAAFVRRLGTVAADDLLKGYLFIATLSSTLSVLALLGLIPRVDALVYHSRAAGMFKGPNVFGSFLVLPLLLYCFYFTQLFPAVRGQAARLLGLSAIVAGLLASGSRGAWLNAVVAVSAVGVAHLWHQRTIRKGAMLSTASGITAVAVATCAALYFTGYAEFLNERASLQRYDDERFGAQRSSIAYALKNPLGAGPGQTEASAGTPSISIARGPVSTHSLYIRALAENGWLGLISVAGLLLVSLTRSWQISGRPWRGSRIGLVCMASLAGLAANSLVIDSVHWRHLWFLLGLTAGLSAHYLTTRTPRDGQKGLVTGIQPGGAGMPPSRSN